ncbi:unnamed protein product [Effrenium voratum]|nr:unnamed protein product [Effrenium voratum]
MLMARMLPKVKQLASKSFRTGVAKLADFGFTRSIGHEGDRPLTGMCTTLWYRAPELLFGAKHYGQAVDLWSAGCVVAELLRRDPLFPGRGEFDMLQKVIELRGTPTEEVWKDVSALPNFLEFTAHAKPPMAQLVPSSSSAGCEFLEALLTLEAAANCTCSFEPRLLEDSVATALLLGLAHVTRRRSDPNEAPLPLERSRGGGPWHPYTPFQMSTRDSNDWTRMRKGGWWLRRGARFDAMRYWHQFSDFARFPGLQYFANIPELLCQAQSMDIPAITQAMYEYNQITLAHSSAFWADALLELMAVWELWLSKVASKTGAVQHIYRYKNDRFSCCIAGADEASEFAVEPRPRPRSTTAGRKVRVKKSVRCGGAKRKLADGTVVNPDGSKTMPDGTLVPADAEEQKLREERRKKQEELEAKAKAEKEAAEEEKKKRAAEAAAAKEREAQERKKALEELEDADREEELKKLEEESWPGRRRCGFRRSTRRRSWRKRKETRRCSRRWDTTRTTWRS